MTNRDGVMADHDFLDEKAHDALLLRDIEGIDILVQPPEKC